MGIAGAFLPLLPTTPFLLLAAFAFSPGSDALHDWLLEHPQLGPPIHHWRAHGAISTRVKVVATISLVVVFALSLIMQMPPWVLMLQGGVICVVALIIWTRRTPPEENS